MENSAPFDLDQALRQWRASFENLGGIHAEELDELEGHLRESISALHAKGLAVPEAFLIATRRLGSERQLSDEFAKANPQRTWTERAMWMVAGVLAAYTLTLVAAPFKSILLRCAIWSGMNGNLIGTLIFLWDWILWAGGAAIAYQVFTRHSSRLYRAVQACFQRPVLSGLGLFLGLECLQYGARIASRLAEPVYSFFTGHHAVPHPQTEAGLGWWYVGVSLLTQLLWIAAGPLLAGYAWRKRGRPTSESPVSYDLDAGEVEAARALHGQGLSLDEASLVLTRRRYPQEVVVPSLGLAISRGIWLERAVWMVTGVALSRCLEVLVPTAWWPLLFLAPPSATPLHQHLMGLASTGRDLTLVGAIIAGLWRWATRYPGQSASISSVCRRRPLLAAIALAAVCLGIRLCEDVLTVYVCKWVGFHGLGMGLIGRDWGTYDRTLTHIIIPIALLLWLARRWRSIQTNPAPCR